MSAHSFAMIVGEIAEEQRCGSFWTVCPCHGDDRPSLLVVDCPGGKIKVKCFGGCSSQKVVGALTALNLLPENNRHIKVV